MNLKWGVRTYPGSLSDKILNITFTLLLINLYFYAVVSFRLIQNKNECSLLNRFIGVNLMRPYFLNLKSLSFRMFIATLLLLSPLEVFAGEAPGDCLKWIGSDFRVPTDTTFNSCADFPNMRMMKGVAPLPQDLDAEMKAIQEALKQSGYTVLDHSAKTSRLRSLIFGGENKNRGQLEVNPYQGKELRISITHFKSEG